MSPDEICRRLGEDTIKTIFLAFTTDAMKKVLREAKLPTTRLASHTSTRRRNEDWAARVWRALVEKAPAGAAAALLFEWLSRSRTAMLADFLTSIEVKNDNGLTEADFMTSTPPEKLLEAGKRLLGRHDRREVAAYLLFLDATSNTDFFAPLRLDQHLAAGGAAAQAT
jgi:hypothetical protein